MKILTGLSVFSIFAATATADFYIGIKSGQMSDGSVYNPHLGMYTTGFVARDGQSVCDAPNMPIEINSDPSAPWWNVCGEDFSAYCDGRQVYMNPDDFCGKNRAGDQTVDDGFFYADLLDKGDGDKKVGRCVFELGDAKTCFVAFGSMVAEYTVRCYTDVC